MSKKRTFYIDTHEDEGHCYTLDFFKDRITDTEADDHAESFVLEEMMPDIGSGIYWCSKQQDFVDNTKESCGKFNCNDYSPCNGKSGRCRHLKNGLTGTGRVFLLEQTEGGEKFIFEQIAQEK
ncbi:MAG: hypothetical protein M1378_01230 [Bacteroidetes bacterium]|nr:hypothetical protein [Bacteroidota bacterium]